MIVTAVFSRALADAAFSKFKYHNLEEGYEIFKNRTGYFISAMAECL